MAQARKIEEITVAPGPKNIEIAKDLILWAAQTLRGVAGCQLSVVGTGGD